MITTPSGIKILRRRVVIRENDFTKLRAAALQFKHPQIPLYDTAEFAPINTRELETSYLMNILKGVKPGAEQYYSKLQKYLNCLEHALYTSKYLNYKIFDDDTGQVYLQYRKDLKPVRLGWGLLEKQLGAKRDPK